MDEQHQTRSANKLATSGNGSIEMEGARGGHPAVDNIKAEKEEEERRSLVYEDGNLIFDKLSQLPSLRCLALNCGEDNINDVLVNLGKSNRLEELKLSEIDIDEETFPLIKSIQNLKLLSVISPSSDIPFPDGEDLPSNLKTLTLECFQIANGNIASLVENLMHFENLFLRDCDMLQDDLWISDFILTADLIIEDLTEGDLMHRRLNVKIEAEYEVTPNTTKSVGRLRITNDVQDHSTLSALARYKFV